MIGDEYLSTEILRHGAYLCIWVRNEAEMAALPGVPMPALADHLGLESEFTPDGPPPQESIAFLRRQTSGAGDIPDGGVERAHYVIHVASRSSDPVTKFCVQARGLL